MFSILKSIFKARYAIIALAITGAWNIYQFTIPDKPVLDPHRKKIAEKACWEIIDSIPETIKPSSKTVVLRFLGDETRVITTRLEELIERTGKCILVDKGIVPKILRELKIEEKQIGTYKDAFTVGKRCGADYAIYGEIEKFVSDQDNAWLAMNVNMIDLNSEKTIMSKVIDLHPNPVGSKIASVSGWSKILFWLLFTLSLPFIFIKIIKKLLDKESNSVNFLVIVALTITSLFVALLLTGFKLGSFWSGLLILFSFILSTFYSYLTVAYIEKLRR